MKPKVTKFDQKVIDAYEGFIKDVYESCLFVRMGVGKEHQGVIDTLMPLINAHEKRMWKTIEDEMDKSK